MLSKKCWFHGSSFSRGRQRTPKTPGAVQSSRLAVPKASHADAALQERILTESVLELQVVRRIQEPRRLCTTARLSWEREHCASLGATSEACRCRAWRKLMSTGSRVLVTAFGAAVATTARGSVLCMHIPDPRGWFPDGSPTGAIVGTKTDEKVCKCGSWADPTDGSAPRFGSAHCRSVGGFRWRVGPQGDRPSPENGGDPRLCLSAGAMLKKKAGGEQSDHARAQGRHGCFVHSDVGSVELYTMKATSVSKTHVQARLYRPGPMSR